MSNVTVNTPGAIKVQIGSQNGGSVQQVNFTATTIKGATDLVLGYANTGDVITYNSANGNFTVSPVLSIDITARTTSNAAFIQANSANSLAQAAYNQANLAGSSANTIAAFIQANSAYGQANSAALYANGAFAMANASFAAANNVFPQIQPAYNTANGAFIQANAAYGSQNVTGSYANSAFGVANSASVYANGAFIKANAAFAQANLDFTNITTTAGIYGSNSLVPVVTLAANGRVSNITTIAVATGGGSGTPLTYITVNKQSYTATAAQTIFAIDYTSNVMVFLNGSELDPSEYTGTGSSITLTNAALAGDLIDLYGYKYNTSSNYQLNIANNTVSTSNVTGALTVAGGVGITGNLYTGNIVLAGANSITFGDGTVQTTAGGGSAAGSYANSAFGVANSAAIYANGAFIQANNEPKAVISGSYANSAFGVANSASTYANGAFIQANSAFGVANSASIYANGAFLQANASFISANSAGVYGNTAFNYANGAFIQANSAFGKANTSLQLSGTNQTVSSNVTIQGNLSVTGNISFTGNATTTVITGNTGQFFGYAANGFNALYAGIPTGYFLEPQISFQISSNFNGYSGLNMQNINSGANSSSDLFITSDNGTINDGFLDLGFASSTYNYPGYSLIGKNDGYLFATGNTTTGGGNMIVGTGLGNDVIFATGGLDTTNEVARFKNGTGLVLKNLPITFADGTKQNTAAAPFVTTNSSFIQANAAFLQANAAFLQANSVYTRANNSVNANTGGTVTGTLTVANTFVASYNPSYTNYLQATGSNTGNAVIFSAVGGDANVSMMLQPQGTGAIDLVAGSKGVNISNGNGLTVINMIGGGAGYTSIPTVTISPPTTANGTTATANGTLRIGGTLLMGNVGFGYANGDYLYANVAGSPANVVVQVTSNTATTYGTGGINGFTVVNQGQFISVPTYTNSANVLNTGTPYYLQFTGTTSASGQSANLDIHSSVFIAATPIITSNGSGYVEQPTITFSSASSTATAFATVGNIPTVRTTSNAISFSTDLGELFRITNSNGATTSPAYLNVLGGGSTGIGQYASGGAGAISLTLISKGSSPINFSTNGTATTQQFSVSSTASAVNYLQVTGAATTGLPDISSTGSDTNVPLSITTKGGSSYVDFRISAARQFRVGFAATPVNYLQVVGAATTVGPTMSAQGTDTNIDLNIVTKGTGNTNISTANGTQFRVADAGAGQNTVNYLQVQGSNTANAIIISSQGADANVSMAHIMKGNGSFDIQTSNGAVVLSNGGTVTTITSTFAGIYSVIPTLTISPPTTAGGTQATATTAMQAQSGPTINVAGSGYAVNDTLTLVGGTFTQAAVYTIATISGSGVATVTLITAGSYTVLPSAPVSTTSSGSGTGCTLTPTWGVKPTSFTITNAGSGYVEQPTVTFSSGSATAYVTVGGIPTIRTLGTSLSFSTPSGEVLRLNDTATATPAYFQLDGGSTSVNMRILGGTSSTTSVNFVTKGTGAYTFNTNASIGTQQFQIAHTASAVNYVQVTGAATGTTNFPTISAQGSDTNINLAFVSKNAGYIAFGINAATTQAFRVLSTASSTGNLLAVAGSASGSGPTLSAISGTSGTDANIDINLAPKGTGRVVTTSTLVAGLISGGTF